jgi:hypothetical protein
LNSLRREATLDVRDRLLYWASALDTVRRVTEKGSDASAVKAACYVLEQAGECDVGSIYLRDIVHDQHITYNFEELQDAMNQCKVDEEGYRERCGKLGIEP